MSIKFSQSLLAGVCFISSTALYAAVKEYSLIIDEGTVQVTGKPLTRITVNGQFPAPLLEFEEGDDAVIRVKNHLKNKDSSIHWHGLLLPGIMDGVPGFNGFNGIGPNKEFVYKYLEDNHLQGSCPAYIKLGLQDPKTGVVYSIMTFGKSRFDKNIEYELLRFCNLRYHNVRGAASKLLKAFERAYKPQSLVSYANRDWSQGNVYNKLGFEYQYSSEPNYIYITESQEIIKRQKVQKHKLKEFLESRNLIFKEELSERDNMINNNFRIYYDTGNFLTSFNTNIDKSHKYGLEVYDKFLITDELFTSLNYSYIRAKIDNENEGNGAYNGKDLPGVSKHNVTLNLGYDINNLNTVLSHTYRNSAYAADDFANNFNQKQEAYNSTDLGTSYTYQNVELFAKIQNLFDEDNGLWIKDNAIYPVNFERTYYAGMKVKF